MVLENTGQEGCLCPMIIDTVFSALMMRGKQKYLLKSCITIFNISLILRNIKSIYLLNIKQCLSAF